MALLFASLGLATAQTLTVTGTVVAEKDGQPVAGAYVLVNGTTLGTITNENGEFGIRNVPADAKEIIVTFLGYSTASAPVQSAPVRVVMKEDTNYLDETIVVAYGTATKSSFTGSATMVKSETIENRIATNVTTALAGTAPGVQVISASGDPASNGSSIVIRGIGSMSASNTPLYVVDGMPYDGSISDINPNDVESISVLKDAAASAIYGARGANGVVLITTKRASSNEVNVKVDAKWGSNSRLIPQYDVISDPALYYETHYKRMYNQMLYAGYTSAEAYAYADANIFNEQNGGLGYQVYTIPEGEKFIGTNFKLNPNAKLGYSDGEYYYTPDDWYNESFHNSFRQEYNIAVSGSKDKLSYYGSVGYLNDGGIVNNSGYKRYSARINADYQAKKWMKFTTSMSYSHSDSQIPSYDADSYGSSGSIFYIANTIAPIYPLYVRDAEGNIMKENGRTIYDANQTNFKRPNVVGNAIRDNEVNMKQNYADVLTGKWGVVLTPVKGLNLTANVGLMNDNTRYNALYSQFGSSSGTDGIAYVSHNRYFAVNNQYLAEYKTDFGGSKHNFDILAGFEMYKLKIQSLSGQNDHLFDPFIGELNNADGTSGKQLASSTTNYMTQGILARAQYNYDERYFVSGSFRRDASSRFHKDNRWGDFWSAGLAWVISKEDFFNADWVDLLKIKASYGEQGNDQIGNYRYTTLYEVVNSGGSPAAVPYAKGNKDITWETQGNFNVGVDFDLFRGRISGTLEFFNRKTSDMLFSFPLPPSFGFTSYYANIGDMNNRGVEFELKTTPIKTKDFEWNVNLNITTYKNEVSYLPEARKTYTVDGKKGFTSGNYFYGEDCALYTFHMKKYAGISENGKSLWYKNVTEPVKDENGNEMKDDKGNVITKVVRTTTDSYNEASDYLCGTALPDAYGGFSTSLAWKGFDLSVDFSFQIGGQVYDGDYASMMGSPTANGKGSNIHADMLNAWTASNNSNLPRMQFGDQYTAGTSDRFLTDASYLSLNNINFGYTFPKLLTKKVGVERLRLYVAADNIWVWSKRQGLDPRQSISGSSTGAYYAPIRTISGGVTLTF